VNIHKTKTQRIRFKNHRKTAKKNAVMGVVWPPGLPPSPNLTCLMSSSVVEDASLVGYKLGGDGHTTRDGTSLVHLSHHVGHTLHLPVLSDGVL